MKKKVLSMLVLLAAVATGAWATEPKVYDSGEVEVYSLELGDILLPGVTLTKGSYSTDVVAGAGRYFRDGQIQSGGDFLALYPITIGANGVINNKYNGADNTTDYTPITADGEVGNAWEVTYVDAPSYRPGYKEIHIGGIKYTPAAPAGYTVSLKEGTVDADKWTITPNPATAGTQVKATYSGTKRVKSVKAVKKAAGPLAAAFEDGAKFKVGCRWNGSYTTYLEFTNSRGTYSLTSKSGTSPNDYKSSTLTVKDGNVLVLDFANVDEEYGDRYDYLSAQIEFDATYSTYKYSSKGSSFNGIISVSVNGTDITNQLSEKTN